MLSAQERGGHEATERGLSVQRSVGLLRTGPILSLSARYSSRQVFGDKGGQVLRPNADDIHDADVREDAIRGPLVDRCGAEAELRGDLAHGEEALDRW